MLVTKPWSGAGSGNFVLAATFGAPGSFSLVAAGFFDNSEHAGPHHL